MFCIQHAPACAAPATYLPPPSLRRRRFHPRSALCLRPLPAPQGGAPRPAAAAADFNPSDIQELRDSKQELIRKVVTMKTVGVLGAAGGAAALCCAVWNNMGCAVQTGRQWAVLCCVGKAGGHAVWQAWLARHLPGGLPSRQHRLQTAPALLAHPVCPPASLFPPRDSPRACRSWQIGGRAWGSRWRATEQTSPPCRPASAQRWEGCGMSWPSSRPASAASWTAMQRPSARHRRAAPAALAA